MRLDWSRIGLLGGTAVLVLVSLGLDAAKGPAGVANKDRVGRGKHLVMVLGCNDCHTPFKMGSQGPEPDMTRMLSGHPEGVPLPPPPAAVGPWIWFGSATNTAFAGPWGVTYSVNLTPDSNTGLGVWTEEMFVKAIKTGKHFGTSRQIQPPMPWQWYRYLSDEELKSIYAYLKTVPPIRNRVPDYQEPKGQPQVAPGKK